MKIKYLETTFFLILITLTIYGFLLLFLPRFTYSIEKCEFTEEPKVLVCISPIFAWGIPYITNGITSPEQRLIIISNTDLEYIAHEASHLCQSKYDNDEQRAQCTGVLTKQIYQLIDLKVIKS